MKNNQIFNMIASLEATGKAPENSVISSVQNSKKDKALYNSAPVGYEQTIDTLTYIKQEVIKQKFYEENPGDFIPVKVGEGSFSSEFLYYTNFELSDDFESGIMGQGTGTRKSKLDVGYDAVRLTPYFWSKEIDYSLVEINQAAKNIGSAISLITQREEAGKRNWDLGIQKVSKLGSSNVSGVEGLYNLTGVTNNLVTITKAISSMTPAEIQSVVKDMMNAYWTNNNKTAKPDTLNIPTSDYFGLSEFIDATGIYKSKGDYLLEAFKFATGNPNFKILPSQYADSADNGLGVNRYTLYRNDPQTLEMNIPIDYTTTTFGTINNFDFNSVAYGQFTGVIAKRPKEILYFSY